jgi:predicted ArsR family transcriptional regulator
MLSLLTGAALSAAEIARELDISQANASYHLRVLADAGEVVAAGEEKIRGGVAKRYRHPWNSTAEPTTVAPGSGSSQATAFIEALSTELVRRYALRDFSSPVHASDAEMWVTPAVWEEVWALVRRASELIHDSARPPRSPGTIHVNLTAVLFQQTDAIGGRDGASS